MEGKAKKVIGKPKNRFLITRGVVNGILKKEVGQLDFRSISKVASIVWSRRSQMFDRYFKYLESKEDQLSTQFLKDTLAGSGKIGVQILSKYKCVGQEKLINEADEPEVYLMDFKVNNQSKPIIKFGKSPYSRMRLKNMEAHRKILKIRYDSTTEVGRRSKSKKDTNKGSSQYTRLFATPFTDAQIEDVYVS